MRELYSRCDDHVWDYYQNLNDTQKVRVLRNALMMGSYKNKYFDEKKVIIEATLYALDNNWFS